MRPINNLQNNLAAVGIVAIVIVALWVGYVGTPKRAAGNATTINAAAGQASGNEIVDLALVDNPRPQVPWIRTGSPSPDPTQQWAGASTCGALNSFCYTFMQRSWVSDPAAGPCCDGLGGTTSLFPSNQVASKCRRWTAKRCDPAQTYVAGGLPSNVTECNPNHHLSQRQQQEAQTAWSSFSAGVAALCADPVNRTLCPIPLSFIDMPDGNAVLDWRTVMIYNWSPDQNGFCADGTTRLFSGAVCNAAGMKQRTMLPEWITRNFAYIELVHSEYDVTNAAHIDLMVERQPLPVAIDVDLTVYTTKFEMQAPYRAMITTLCQQWIMAIVEIYDADLLFINGGPALAVMLDPMQSNGLITITTHPLVTQIAAATTDARAQAEFAIASRRNMKAWSCSRSASQTCSLGDLAMWCNHPSVIYYKGMMLPSKMRSIAIKALTAQICAL